MISMRQAGRHTFPVRWRPTTESVYVAVSHPHHGAHGAAQDEQRGEPQKDERRGPRLEEGNAQSRHEVGDRLEEHGHLRSDARADERRLNDEVGVQRRRAMLVVVGNVLSARITACAKCFRQTAFRCHYYM